MNKPPTKANKKLYGSYLTPSSSSSTTRKTSNGSSSNQNNSSTSKTSFLPKFYAKSYQDVHIEEGQFSSYAHDFEGSNLINNSSRKNLYNTATSTSKNQSYHHIVDNEKNDEELYPRQFQWCRTTIVRLLCYTAIFLFSLFCVWITHELRSQSNSTTPFASGGTSGDANHHLWFSHGFLLFLWLIVFSFLWYVYSIVA